MPKIKFTAKGIQAIKKPVSAPGQDKRVEYTENGLILRVAASGTMTWFLRFYFRGRYERLKLGLYPYVSLADARLKEDEALRLVGKGINPVRQTKDERAADTFGALAEKFLKDRASNKSVKEYRRLLEKYFSDWNNVKAHAITPREIVARMDGELKRGDAHARKCFAVLHAMYNYGKGKFIVEANPLHGLPRPGEVRERDRVLAADEIRHVWRSMLEETALLQAQFKLRFYTAQRGGEVLTIEWSEIDFDSAMWNIPANKSKNGHAHRVPLTAQALEILYELRRGSSNSRWVFPSRFGKDESLTHVQKAIQRIRNRAGVVKALTEEGIEVTAETLAAAAGTYLPIAFTGHDIRRSAASHMASLGVHRFTISRILNHVSQDGVTGIYDRYSYDKEKRDALQLWAGHLDEIIKGSAPKRVVSIVRSEFVLLRDSDAH